VVGMNPNKKYLVTPDERATLIRRMLEQHSVSKNVRVQGTCILSTVCVDWSLTEDDVLAQRNEPQ